MINLKQYGYIEAETPPIGLIPERVMELQQEQYTVITEQGEVTAVQCRFNDCRHQTEPGYAVLTALVDGSLAPEHWERLLVQKRENKSLDDSGYLMDKTVWQMSIAIRHKGKKGGYKK